MRIENWVKSDLIPLGFYEVVPQTETIQRAEEVRQEVLRMANHVCEVTDTAMACGKLIIKLIPPDPDDPESEMMLTVGWKIYLTKEQIAKLKEDEEWQSSRWAGFAAG